MKHQWNMVHVRLHIWSRLDFTGFDCVWLIAYTKPCQCGSHTSLSCFFSRTHKLSSFSNLSGFLRPEISAYEICSSVLEDTTLNLLLQAQLCHWRIKLRITQPLEQSSHSMVITENQRSDYRGSLKRSALYIPDKHNAYNGEDEPGAQWPLARVDCSCRASTLILMGDTTPTQPDRRRNCAYIPVDEVPHYTLPLVWDDNMKDHTHFLVQVSENTANAPSVVPWAIRPTCEETIFFRSVETARCPPVETTRCPPVVKLLQWDQKQADASMAKIQSLVLDAVALLVHIVEATRGSLSSEQAAEAAKAVLSLLGNASVHISSMISIFTPHPSLWTIHCIDSFLYL